MAVRLDRELMPLPLTEPPNEPPPYAWTGTWASAAGLTDDTEPWWDAPEPEVPADVRSLRATPPGLGALADHWIAFERFAEEIPREAPFGFAVGGPLDLMEPSSVLASFTADAFEEGLAKLSDDELVGMLYATRRLSSWQAAMELAAVSELESRRQATARPGSSRDQDHVSAELGLTLTMTARSTEKLLDLARGLARFPGVQTALLAGRIDRSRVAVMVEELASLDLIPAAAIAAAFVNIARKMTTSQLRAEIRRMILDLFPALIKARAQKGRRHARVDVWQELSGNGAMAGRELPQADVIAADTRISAIAQTLKCAGATGTMDEIRAAVFVALLTGRDPATLLSSPLSSPLSSSLSSPDSAGAGDPPSAGGGLARLTGSVHLTLPLKTWLGWSDAPGEAAGYGPLHADTCRDLASRMASPRWCLTLTDEQGRAAAHACSTGGPGPPGVKAWLAGLRFDWLERGDTCRHSRQTTSYRPGKKLRHLIQVRQRTCANPVCRRPAEVCDLDHTIPFDQGGRTCECDSAPVCRRHHRCKQAPGWRLVQQKPGYLVWTTPSGRSFPATPDRYPI